MSKGRLVAIITASVTAGLALLYTLLIFLTASVYYNDEFLDQTLEVFSEYSAPSIKATAVFPLFFDCEFGLSVTEEGTVDTAVIGEYTLTYKTAFLSSEKSRTVKVVDTISPEITLENNIFKIDAECRPVTADMVDIGCEITDNYDGNITERLEKTVEGDICYYRATDSSGNIASAEVRIIYIDNIGPSISLKGLPTVYFPLGGQYKEYGYNVSDNYDEKIAERVVINSNVDMNRTGTYYVRYFVSDSSGNADEVERRVIVYGGGYDSMYDTVKPNGKVVYLTFDDGPSRYTEELLGILREYNVKATFFVTDQQPQYRHLIGKAYNEGHSVGVHTLSHLWSIYKSEESYLADFNAMNALIEAETGSPAQIFRFPGGTGNTASRNHSKGIMTRLSKLMTDSGYFYFDWNVSSGDTDTSDPSDIINNLINQVSKKETSMILAHDNKGATIKAMPGFIEYCLKNGYTFKVITRDTTPIRANPRN